MNVSSPSAKDLQIERGILRYLTRASMKATPFGSFCGVVEGGIVDAPPDAQAAPSSSDAVETMGSIRRLQSVVRLNKTLHTHLWEYLKRRPAVRDRLAVVVNPTVRREASQVVFVALLGSVEVLQRTDATEALALVLREANLHHDCPYSQLVALLSANAAVDATPDEARTYLDGLVRIGLLRFVSPVRAQDVDWTSTLATALERIDDPHVRSALAFLAAAQEVVTMYAGADTNARAELGDRLRSLVDGLVTELGLFPFADNALLLYEDCGADLVVRVRRTPPMAKAFDSIVDFVVRTQSLSPSVTEMTTMRHFFDRQYEGDRDAIPLLTFFDDYYRVHLKEHLTKEHRLNVGDPSLELRSYDLTNPFGLDEIRRRRMDGAAWVKAVQAAWAQDRDAEEIDIASDAVSSADGARMSRGPRSISAFCQFASGTEAGGPRIILINGQTFLGFGKYFSRFLYLMPSSFTEAVASENALMGGEWLAEIGGDSDFNANLHPVMLPKLIVYPTGDAEDWPAGISCLDLDVMRGLDDPFGLVLRHRPTGAQVFPVDLGFLNPRRRPALYRMLASFSPTASTFVPLPSSWEPATNAQPELAPRIVYRPRIVYGRQIVLARRRWTVPAALYPWKRSNESDGDYFIRVNEWRTEHAIPTRVFVKVIPPRVALPKAPDLEAPEQHADNTHAADAPSEQDINYRDDGLSFADAEVPVVADGAHESRGKPPAPPGTQTKVQKSRDFTKPQFIDFEMPLLTDLFGRLPATLREFTAHLDEEYPAADGRPIVEGQPHAAEYVLQVNWIPAT
jgi:hypothetical protein